MAAGPNEEPSGMTEPPQQGGVTQSAAHSTHYGGAEPTVTPNTPQNGVVA